MTAERFLVTGASGCIGAWVVRRLVRQNVATAAMSMSGSLHRLRLILNAGELAQVHFIREDVADLDAVVGAVEACQPTHVIHLAALQLPFCKADPVRGAGQRCRDGQCVRGGQAIRAPSRGLCQ